MCCLLIHRLGLRNILAGVGFQDIYHHETDLAAESCVELVQARSGAFGYRAGVGTKNQERQTGLG